MDHHKAIQQQRLRRRRRVRAKITGTPERPRLSVFRSNKNISAQLIDDLVGVTLAAVSSQAKEIKAQFPYGGNVQAATAVGKALAEKARAKGIVLAAFDRGHYKFHGRVKALAEAANAAGLKCCEMKKPPKEKPAEPKKEAGKKEAAPKGKKEDKKQK